MTLYIYSKYTRTLNLRISSQAQLAALTASGDAQAKYIMELEKRLREALDALERERRAHVHTRETLTAQVIKEVMDREITVLECRALVQRRDKLREHMIRQLLERRRAVRVARLVNRLRHPYHKVDGDFASEVFRRVQRLCVCVCLCVSVCIYTYTCIHIDIHIHVDIQIHL